MATQRILPGQYGRGGIAYAQQEAENIRARQAAAQSLAQQKRESELAAIEARALSEKLKREADFAKLTTETNAAWDQLKFKEAQKGKAKPIRISEVERDEKGNETGRTITREESPDVFAANKRALELKTLNDKRDLLKDAWFFPKIRGIPAKIADVEQQIAAAQAPTDLLAAPTVGQPAPAAVTTPTPRGFVGSPGANTFLADPSPLGMNRAQTNAYAIDKNNPTVPPQRDLLRSDSFPDGFNPAHGSFQIGAAPAPAQNNFQPAVGNMRLLERDAMNPPVPEDAPMADFVEPQDAPAKPGSPSSVYESPEQVRDSFRAKKIDRETAKILLSQFNVK